MVAAVPSQINITAPYPLYLDGGRGEMDCSDAELGDRLIRSTPDTN